MECSGKRGGRCCFPARHSDGRPMAMCSTSSSTTVFQEAIDALASHYTSAAPPEKGGAAIAVSVSGVHDFAAYVRTVRYLESLGEVESVEVLAVVSGRVRLGLKLRTGVAGTARADRPGTDAGRGCGRRGRRPGAAAAAVTRHGHLTARGEAAGAVDAGRAASPAPGAGEGAAVRELRGDAGQRGTRGRGSADRLRSDTRAGADRGRPRCGKSHLLEAACATASAGGDAVAFVPMREWRTQASMRCTDSAGAVCCASTTWTRSRAIASGRRRARARRDVRLRDHSTARQRPRVSVEPPVRTCRSSVQAERGDGLPPARAR